MIETDGLFRRYGRALAVDDLSFRVPPGQILGLVGPNGAGKTTTLRTLAGIDRPSAGRVMIGGHDIEREPLAARRACGFVADEPRLFETLTVWEHLDVTAALYALDAWRPEADSLLARFELGAQRDRPVESLSLGMRQKVAICCACLVDPVALLFDEPLTGLDPSGIRTITGVIRERAQAGASVVVSSHLLSLVESLCTHVLVLDHGRCLLHASVSEVLERATASQPSDGRLVDLESAFMAMIGDPAD